MKYCKAGVAYSGPPLERFSRGARRGSGSVWTPGGPSGLLELLLKLIRERPPLRSRIAGGASCRDYKAWQGVGKQEIHIGRWIDLYTNILSIESCEKSDLHLDGIPVIAYSTSSAYESDE